MKAGKPRRERPAATAAAVTETHEPDMPLPGWPRSHADSALTDADADECVVVTIHGVKHHLHATTAQQLHASLGKTLGEYNKVAEGAGLFGV
jgi:hypothetical protein